MKSHDFKREWEESKGIVGWNHNSDMVSKIYGECSEWWIKKIDILLKEKTQEIRDDLLKIADEGEYEDLRREVDEYFGKNE